MATDESTRLGELQIRSRETKSLISQINQASGEILVINHPEISRYHQAYSRKITAYLRGLLKAY